jgi:signal transduction histidine kinase
VAAGRPDLVGKINIAQLDITKEVIRHQSFALGSSVMSATYAHPMIHFALPIPISTGTSDFFIGKAAQLDTWGIEFDRTHFPQGATLTITDRCGLLLYRYPVEANTGALGRPIPKPLWDKLARGEGWQGRFINKRKDGTLYEEDSIISPVRDAAGKIVNYVSLGRDVSREAALEAQLRQSQKQEAIGQLAGGVAHDFNNILAVMLFAAEGVSCLRI